MKNNKGITISSLVVYVIAMAIVVATMSRITSYFYSNMDEADTKTRGSVAYTSFNTRFSEEINTGNNYPVLLGTNGEYIVFSKTGNQYTFKNGAIYQNQIKICKNIENCTFETIKSDESKETVDLVKVTITTEGDKVYTNTYKIQSF